MLWSLVTSSPSWPPDWPAKSWRRESRATATCCPSADASNRPTLKTRALERANATSLYYLILYILSFPLSFPQCSTEKLKTIYIQILAPLLFFALISFVLHACTLLHVTNRSPEEPFLSKIMMWPLLIDKYTSRKGILYYNSRYGKHPSRPTLKSTLRSF